MPDLERTQTRPALATPRFFEGDSQLNVYAGELDVRPGAPTITWQKLRTDPPGKYEQAVNPVPDPNTWFRARVVVANPKTSVFVNDAKDPCLMVNLLNGRKKGLIGLWVGNNSGGDSPTSSSLLPRSERDW